MSFFPLSQKKTAPYNFFKITVYFHFLKPKVVVQKKVGITGLVFYLSVLEAKK